VYEDLRVIKRMQNNRQSRWQLCFLFCIIRVVLIWICSSGSLFCGVLVFWKSSPNQNVAGIDRFPLLTASLDAWPVTRIR